MILNDPEWKVCPAQHVVPDVSIIDIKHLRFLIIKGCRNREKEN